MAAAGRRCGRGDRTEGNFATRIRPGDDQPVAAEEGAREGWDGVSAVDSDPELG